jgi:hypothetical protein
VELVISIVLQNGFEGVRVLVLGDTPVVFEDFLYFGVLFGFECQVKE